VRTRGQLMGLIPLHYVIFEEETAVVEALIDEFPIGAFIEVKKRKNMDNEMMNILRRGPPRQHVTNHSDHMILPPPLEGYENLRFVTFHTIWSASCLKVMPLVEQIASSYPSVSFFSVRADCDGLDVISRTYSVTTFLDTYGFQRRR